MFAEFEDVEKAYEGTIPSAGEERIQYLLDALSARLRLLIPDLTVRTAANPDLEITARDVVVQAVIRRMPGSTQQVRSESEGIGPFSRTLTYTTDSGGDFPDQDLALLGGGPVGVGTIGTIRLGPVDWTSFA